MALTINRKDEIRNEEFAFIKQKFGQNTNSQAIYACIKFVVNYLPALEAEIDEITVKVFETNKKYLNFVDAVKKKSKTGKEITSI